MAISYACSSAQWVATARSLRRPTSLTLLYEDEIGSVEGAGCELGAADRVSDKSNKAAFGGQWAINLRKPPHHGLHDPHTVLLQVAEHVRKLGRSVVSHQQMEPDRRLLLRGKTLERLLEEGG